MPLPEAVQRTIKQLQHDYDLVQASRDVSLGSASVGVIISARAGHIPGGTSLGTQDGLSLGVCKTFKVVCSEFWIFRWAKSNAREMRVPDSWAVEPLIPRRLLTDGVCVQCGSLAPAQPSGASCDVFMLPLPFGKGSVERKAWKPALLWSTWRGREAGGLEGSSLTSGVMASSAFQQKWDSSTCIQAKNPLWHWDMKAVA